MLLTCVLFAICLSRRLRLLKSNINTQLHCKIVITLNGGGSNVGRFTRAAFVADGTGSVVAEHRKIRPPLPRCKMLLRESLQSRLQLTHIWVFSDQLLWLLKIYQPEKYMREPKSATLCGGAICPDLIWPSDLYRLFSSFCGSTASNFWSPKVWTWLRNNRRELVLFSTADFLSQEAIANLSRAPHWWRWITHEMRHN